MIESLDTVFYTAIFLLPGFLIINIIDSTNPPKRQFELTYILKCLLYSLINCACCSPLYSIIANIKCEFLYWLLFVTATILVAVVIGVIVSFIKQKNIIIRFLAKFNISSFPSTPTAWDYVFSKQESYFVIVTLNNGERVRGWYSNNSFASSDQDNKDLFIEKAFFYEKNGKWIEDKESSGLYIPGNQIKLIELKGRAHNE